MLSFRETPVSQAQSAMRQLSPAAIVRPARIEEAAALSDLCVRSKAIWGYDDGFLGLAREALQVKPTRIEAGDVWIATVADHSIAGVVSLGPGDDADSLDLDKLFVEPRQIAAGYGRALL